MASSAFAASVTLDWFRNPEPDIVNYKVYYGTASGQYSASVSAGNNTNATVTGLNEGVTYFFAATAVNAAGLESKPSQEIDYLVAVTQLATNYPPLLAGPANFSAPRNTATYIAGLSVTDADAGSGNITIVISANRGAISVLTDVPGGIAPAQIAFNRTANVQISAPQAAINATFARSNGIVYTGQFNLVGPDVLSFTLNDNGNAGPGGAQSTFRQITANVTGDSVDTWRNISFNIADLIDPSRTDVWGDDADPDQDAFVNLQEYALGRDPLVRESGTNNLFSGTEQLNGETYNTLTFVQRKNETAVQYIVEVSPDGSTWSSGAGAVVLSSSLDLSPMLRLVTYRDALPATQTRAIRLRITRL